ncbi:MAG: hypothetical protein V7K50_04025 [Nostoc sp.]|uniref:hypothetical protein n=1 Tax=Nostoc sp. TaxID=1180 RepID=UPI002FFBC5F9
MSGKQATFRSLVEALTLICNALDVEISDAISGLCKTSLVASLAQVETIIRDLSRLLP